MDDIDKRFGELSQFVHEYVDKQVEVKTQDYRKALHQAIEILQAIAGEPTMTCDTCGDEFVPIKKVVKTRHAYCGENCIPGASGDSAPNPSQEYIELMQQPKRNHVAMKPEVKFSPVALETRSSIQKMRRTVEKQVRQGTEDKPTRYCLFCSMPTTKPYCNDDCRKKDEAQFVEEHATATAPQPVKEETQQVHKVPQLNVPKFKEDKRTYGYFSSRDED
jgi:hypothetical protein